MMKPATLALVFLMTASVSACASGPAAYGPSVGAGPGYSETALDLTRYAVGFRGNSRTSDAAVTQMVFYRAAELTLALGFDQFRVLAQTIRTASEDVAGEQSFEPTMSRAYPHNLYGYITSEEWSVSTPRSPTQHFEADIVIVMLPGDIAPAQDYFSARDIVTALKDKITK